MGRISQIKEALRNRIRPSVPVPERDDRPWWDSYSPDPPWPGAHVVKYVVTDRAFLLGLDELYRTAMKVHERGELRACARRVAEELDLEPENVPVEGYYTEDADLASYFLLIRALQAVPLERESEVQALPQFRRLLDVTSSPIFGPPIREHLLPVGRDPLSAALKDATSPREWTVPLLTVAAARKAQETDDYSLVGLACHTKDAVLIAALRESVVLYAEAVTIGSMTWPQFEWQVSPELSARVQRFVDTFNTLFGRELPPPTPQYAHAFAAGTDETRILGRCVRLGQTDPPEPQYYHWAIAPEPGGQLTVDDFWAPELWTTERYRKRTGAVSRLDDRCKSPGFL
jgi:hypothetical protein